ncbi:unnamed protein product [Cuscuta europaea]|uniref:Uncharacterized protein n=1 Tax=Cuscuta europaea TaxID=41803 RepID=A0A9P1E4L7_CUSEU|nr:unnamed protein product [Cuscuta europaea]
MQVGKIASRCLKVKRDDRPTMKEVAMEIEGLRVLERHPGGGLGENETSSKDNEYISSFESSHTITNVRYSFTSGGKTSEGEHGDVIYVIEWWEMMTICSLFSLSLNLVFCMLYFVNVKL